MCILFFYMARISNFFFFFKGEMAMFEFIQFDNGKKVLEIIMTYF